MSKLVGNPENRFSQDAAQIFQTLDEVQKTEFVKKTMEVGSGIGEGLGKAGETIYKQGQNIGQSAPFKTVSEVSHRGGTWERFARLGRQSTNRDKTLDRVLP